MKKFILAGLFAFSTVFSTNAQSLQEYDWSSQKITFEAPTNSKIVKSEGNYFQTESKNISVILLIVDSDFDLINTAKSRGISFIDSFLHHWENKGYYGSSIEGKRKNKSGNIMCAKLKRKNSTQNVYVEIVYADGYLDLAEDVLFGVQMTN